MPFAYVTEPGSTVGRSGRTIVVKKARETLAEWELTRLETLVLIGGVNLTTPAMKLLLRHGVETALLSANGRLIGQLTPPRPANVTLRLAQYSLSQDASRRLLYSKRIVTAKVNAMLDVVRRFLANYPNDDVREDRRQLEQSLQAVEACESVDTLRGVEGNSARIYWRAFTRMNRSPLEFSGRSRRPPRDPVNALLSLGYVFLTNEIWSLLDAIGFDPYLGFYHEVGSRRPSLALDMIEPFRHRVIDRMVMKAINLGRFSDEDFLETSQGGYRLTKQAMKTFVAEYERSLQAISSDAGVTTPVRARDQIQQAIHQWKAEITGTESAGLDQPESTSSDHAFDGALAEEG